MTPRPARLALPLTLLALALGCDSRGPASTEAVSVELPFAVGDGAEGLLFTYLDAEGAHTVEHLADVPEAQRERVAVRSLSLAPEARPPAGQLFVVDLRAPSAGGRYAAHLVSREEFDRWADEASGRDGLATEGAEAGEVVLYGASWCGACRSAAAFLRAEGVSFRELDIERDDAAREEMVRKLRARGMPSGGIPVIDFRGTVLQGFDRPALEGLIGASARPI